ncbi:putative galacturonosyltransferase 15 [Glycine max]|nr:putative galacturonosyltransferase 15 [Glycine max]
MKFYVSAKDARKGSVKTTVPADTVAARRISSRTVLVLGIVFLLSFVRVAVLVLESSAVCSTFDCVGSTFFGGGDADLKLRDELTRALIEAKVIDGNANEGGAIMSFNELVKVLASKQDLKAFAFKTKAMLLRMEREVQSARKQESLYWHIASHGVPQSLHCLCLKLAEEYAVNAIARSRLPLPEHVSRLVDPTFHHIVLLTDNVLAASVVVTSTVENSANPERLVFHVVTDKKTFTPMHTWFAINSINSAVVEVRGLHHYDWSKEVNAGVKDMQETNNLIWKHYYSNYKQKELDHSEDHNRYLEALRPSSLSLLNHLRIYIPEVIHISFLFSLASPNAKLFPDLNKVVLLDDDVVVQHDLSSLWELDLNGKVSGSVFKSWCENSCCPGNKYVNFLNFSHPIISSNFDGDKCAWLFGVDIFDLEAWRKSDITKTYHQWLKLNVQSGLTLWNPGMLPAALIAFEGQVHPIDTSWLVTDLGYRHRSEEIGNSIERVETAAVVHFNGPAKPWLEIGLPEVRSLWTRYVNFSDKFISKCRIIV